MKKTVLISTLIVSLFLIMCCKKDKPTAPVVLTADVTEISYTTATSGGEVTGEGGSPVLSKGVCWSTSANPTTSNNLTNESAGSGSYSSHITQLTVNTVYYVRAYATNSAGTGYGNQVSFNTSPIAVPSVTGAEITFITPSTAISGGNVTSENGGSVTERGVCWSISHNPAISDSKTSDGTGTGEFISSISGLTGGTTYYVRPYATNNGGTSYGPELSFTTDPPVPPALTTADITSLTTNSVIGGGTVTNEGGATVSTRGMCWSTIPNPTTDDSKTADGTGPGSFTSAVTGLLPNTTYHLRAFATNSAGTTYGNDLSILTYTVGDISGNFYHSVTINTQIWMKENLSVTKYNNGDDIGTTSPPLKDISSETNPQYQWPAFGDEASVALYGRLYTWYAINDNRKVCPAGWHVPTDAEWTTMEDWLTANGYNYDGTTTYDTYNKLAKALASTTFWKASDVTGSVGNTDFPEYRNKSGFTALPAASRYPGVSFGMNNSDGAWWSATSGSEGFAWLRSIYYGGANEPRSGSTKNTGISVRCIKD
jgi:uncharacterized protein (TIGR02145 family)